MVQYCYSLEVGNQLFYSFNIREKKVIFYLSPTLNNEFENKGIYNFNISLISLWFVIRCMAKLVGNAQHFFPLHDKSATNDSDNCEMNV